MAQKTGLFVGLNKGFVVAKPATHPNTFKKQLSLRKGRLHPRVAAVREVILEVAGLAPYQRKMLEMIKTGIVTKEKKALKMAKARLGSQKRAQRMRDNLNKIIMAQKRSA